VFTIDITRYPTAPWVYLFKDKKDTILYIGKAKNLQKRIWQYFLHTSLRKQEMLQKAQKVDFLIVKNESEALYLEDNLIKRHQPFYNNLLKADNSYTYIKITKEQFPQIVLTKRRINDGSLYIGPKKDSIQLKKFLQYLRQILKFRWCKPSQFNQAKLCSDYYFWLCRGRCKLLSARSGLQDVAEYKKIIATIVSFFKGNTKPIEREIHEQIEIAIVHQNFERAAQLRDVYSSLQWFVEQQDVVLSQKIDGYLAVVRSIGNYRVYTVLLFVQGKLMDVITSKEHHSDIDKDSLFLAIQRTFGISHIMSVVNQTLLIGNTLKIGGSVWFPVRKANKELQALLDLAEFFFESYVITQSLQEESVLRNDMFATLKDRYMLQKIPYRIECIDISHLGGDWVVWWLSCFVAGLPYKKWYRRYKIQGSVSAAHSERLYNDYASLQEVLQRRIQSWWPLPDLFIIDGGKGQLGMVKKLYKDLEWKKILSQIDIVALGKGEARKKSNIWTTKSSLDSSVGCDQKIAEKVYVFDKKLAIAEIVVQYDQADKIILKARDEAHRFANSYRKKRMSKERM